MRNIILTLIIWIMAFIAITAGAVLTYDWYKNHGREIVITFYDASGLVPDQSKIIYRGVPIGTVTKIIVSTESGNPVVRARISLESAKLLGPDSKFWIVRPELSFGGVRNLGAISTGNYIAVDPEPGEPATKFEGLEQEITDPVHEKGLHIKLRAGAANGINVGTAITYNGLQIGEVIDMGLSSDQRTIVLSSTIYDKYRTVVRRGSYFGNVSGFHAELHFFGGSEIDMESMRTLINGGISLFTPDLKAAAAKSGDVFKMLTADQLRALNDS